MNVLEGIRVLDFGRFIAGPFCAALLADFGADVIRIDRVGGSEDRFVAPVTSEGEGAFFLQVNRNKRSITLDLDSEEGRAVVRKLLLTTDVVVANMPPRTIAALGLDYDSLRKVKPDIILTASSAFGADPAVRDRVGFDGVAQAMSGAVHLTGLPDHPMKSMVPVVDFSTALCCALGTMMALYERKASGEGQEVSASLLHTALTLSSGSLIEEALRGLNRQATVNRSPTYGPSDIFRVKDGWIIAQVIGPAMFKRWTRMVDRPELLDDPRFADDAARGEHGEILGDIMSDWCASRTREQALAVLEEARIPGGPVNTPRQALEDEVVRACGAFHGVDYPGAAAQVPLVATPVSLSRTAPAIARRPPTAGEHTEQVLRDAGYAPGEIAGLRERGVI
ncbi:CaiB/BaiF CoA transferase family protein [Cupriavidus necator]|uniref:CaiB/BaiF CoA transferase family protein n=1 Tax=Cupriavidus necator TaxID=106590 RepID=UPI0027868831|nr:CoA transferase [Cupriavidus necator]MDQ0141327.1 formyl-CoA transferase [Cupriavidus necator]